MKQKLIFTALPNGIVPRTKKIKLSVVISLQVVDSAINTKIKSVPDMHNWPDLINNARFEVLVNGTAVNATKISPDADIELWKNLFTPSVNVNAFVQEDKSAVPIYSYPVANIISHIKAITDTAGRNFLTDMPDATYYTINDDFTSISNYDVKPYKFRKGQHPEKTFAKEQHRDLLIKGLYVSKPFVPFNPRPEPEIDFAQLCNFHGLYDVAPAKKFKQFPKPDFEFHDIVTILSHYPKLVRRLGLVLDFEIGIGEAAFSTVVTVPAIQVFPAGLDLSEQTTITCPSTAYELTKKGFYSKGQTGSFHDKGHVKINTDDFTVFQIDTDGAALKLVSHVDALMLKKARAFLYAQNAFLTDEKAIPAHNNEQTPRREGLPSHRTAGIAIAKNGMAEYLNTRLVRMNVLEAALATAITPPAGVKNRNASYVSGTEILYADDVNIGYRMDVKMIDKSGTPDAWHSLHFNENTYSFLNSFDENVTIDDMGPEEGFIQLSTTEDKSISGPHMKLSEVIARWEGWSLAVPMPGLSLNEPTLDNTKQVAENDADEAEKYKTPNDVPFKLNVLPVISKGTLPRLRFGQTYAVKLRMVDMAGNSVSHDSDPENAADAIVNDLRYMRYEPVDAPFLIPGNIPKDGESSEVMVIRSNEGQSVQQYENDAAHQDPAHTFPHKNVCTRHVKPPRTTVGMAINHGMLEQAIGNGSMGIDAVYNKIKNDKDPFVKSDKFHKKDGKDIFDYDPAASAPIENGNTVSLPVEYLVDPMAAGVSFFISSIDPNIKSAADIAKFSRRFSFYFDDEIITDDDANKDFDYNNWMSPQTFRIVLKEGDLFDFEWSNNAERKLTVSMPKGFMMKLNYACLWKPKDIIKLSGVLDLMSMKDLKDRIGQSIAKGRHWLFSPWRTLTLVHAVQQPVTTSSASSNTLPFVNNATSIRDFLQTSASLNIDLEVHGASTGVVDIEGDWTDWIDDITYNGVQQISKTAKVHHYSVGYHIYHYVFGDFPDKGIINNQDKALLHHFNDTKHRWVNYKVIASSRYKEYFFNLISDKKLKNEEFKITRESNEIQKVNVLSSARPMAPQVAYVIPTFEWGEDIQGDTTYRGRGSGLRIYLKRPWYSSGEGEKLAIVLLHPFNSSKMTLSDRTHIPINESAKVCTTWGNDPSKLTPVNAGGIFPGKEVFVGVKSGDADNLYSEENLSIVELKGVAVNIVAYDLEYDEERQLYYADIMMNFGVAYFPFVRLSLAAYQQHSVRKAGEDCCLSKIVQADYIQIPPPRVTSLKRNANNVIISISGTLPDTSQRDNYIPKVEFIIEPLDFPKSEDVVINVESGRISSHSKIIPVTDIINFTFTHSHHFILPPKHVGKPYRVKIFEYEMITFDPRRPNPNPRAEVFEGHTVKERMVFADVYEVLG